MKKLTMLALMCAMLGTNAFAEDEGLKPYTLACTVSGTLQEANQSVSKALESKGFKTAGTYSPMSDGNLSVIAITHPLLQKNVVESGGLQGFAGVLRIGLQKTEKGIQVAYTTPAYWGNAYYQKSYTKIEKDFVTLETLLHEALGTLGEATFKPYGSEDGLSARELRKYHYMISMPYFEDVEVLQDKSSYAELIKRIETRAPGSKDAKIVYSVKFDDAKLALFGIALTGEDGEKNFLPTIDFNEPRATPFLPYEMLVMEDRAVMLHGKYRIALSFPDLGMVTFMKIMSTPDDIAETMSTLVKDE